MQRSPRIQRTNTLFWKMLWGLLGAMLLSGVVVFGVALGMQYPAQSAPLVTGPYASDRSRFAEEIARAGGKSALLSWLQGQKTGSRRTFVYAVGPDKTELSGRSLPDGAIDQALLFHSKNPADEAVKEILADGSPVLVFTAKAPVGLFESTIRLYHSRWRMPFWMVCLISILAASAVASGLAWQISRPMRDLQDAMKKAASGDLSARVSKNLRKTSTEFHLLADQFDQMAETIQQLVERQQKLFHSVSHELRSPLARINCAVELARKSSAQTPKMLDRIEKDVRVLDALVGDLLTYTRLNTQLPIDMANIDVNAVIAEIADNAALEGQAKGIEVNAEIPDSPTMAYAHEGMLYHAVENIVRNALRYSPEHSTILLQVILDPANNVVIRVQDEGPGVPPEELDKIFEPFVRGQKQATGSGYGLGLAIASEAVRHHKGILTARNVEPHGLEMVIRFPAGQAEHKHNHGAAIGSANG